MNTSQEQDKQLASATLELLKRVDIKGGDVPAFVQITDWLVGIASATPAAVPQERHQHPTGAGL